MPDSLVLAADNPVSVQWLPLITTWIVFGVAFWVLARYVWPRITRALDEREQKIRDEIRAAEEAGAKARAAQEEYERSLRDARREASEMIARAKADAKAVAEALRAQREQELAEMKQHATRDIEAAKRGAINELHAEAANLAAAIASKILQREISVEDQQRLVEESLRELGRSRSNGHAAAEPVAAEHE
jgi:F-type H+-transporting ATPase subunit b